MGGFATTFICSLVIAALSTAGDFVWATWIPEHRAAYGLVHGTLLFCAIGLVLGVFAGRLGTGAAAGAVIGAAGAGFYYLAAPFFGFLVMVFAWAGLWMALAFLYAHLNDRHPGGVVFARGAIASAASGLSFYLISGIWRPFDPQGMDYALHFAAWTVAYFPGFAALLMAKKA